MQTRTRRGIALLTLTGLLAVATAGLVLARSDRAAPLAADKRVLAVDVRPLAVQDGFTVRRPFTGRVEARRQSVLGFESPGRLARVLVDEGMAVTSGQVLAELDTERLAATRDELLAAQARAKAELALADATLKRLRGVVDKGGVSRQGLDEAREGRRAALAAVRLAAQRIDSLDVDLAKSRLRAPFSGTIVARSADEGRVLGAGDAVLTVQEDSAPEIRVGIAGAAIEQLTPGERYELQWRGRTLHAELRTLLPLRAATARTVDALFDPLDGDHRLLPGDVVTLILDRQVTRRGSWLPLTALAEGERGLWSLYVAEALDEEQPADGATHRIVRHTVDVLHQSDEQVFVRGSLQPGKAIVVTGLQRIVPGQQVRIAAERIAGLESTND